MPEFENVPYNEVKRRVNAVLDKFIQEKRLLLERDISERALTGELVNYLKQEFPLWDVDPEFNKMYSNGKNRPKTLTGRIARTVSRDGHVTPDIIIHKNGPPPNPNLLVILAKKESNTEDREGEKDMQDLPDYISELGYKYGLFIQFKVKENAGSRPTGKWFPSEENL
jgi:hypothetical protein